MQRISCAQSMLIVIEETFGNCKILIFDSNHPELWQQFLAKKVAVRSLSLGEICNVRTFNANAERNSATTHGLIVIEPGFWSSSQFLESRLATSSVSALTITEVSM